MSALAERPIVRNSVQLSTARGQVRRNTHDNVLLGLLTVGVLVVTGLPYVFGYVTTPAGRHFMGIVLNVPDTAQYLSWARESMNAVFIEDKLTPEHGPAVYFNLFWLIIGRLAGALHIDLAEAAQVARPLTGVAYIVAIYWFAGIMFADRGRRWTASLIAILGAGLGWTLVLEKLLTHSTDVSNPLDLYVTEPNTLLSIMAFPLQAIASALVVWTLGLAALAFERDSIRIGVIAGVAGLLLCLQHGYDLIVVYAVVCTVAAIRFLLVGNRLRLVIVTAAICGPSAPAALYNVYITSTSPIWRGALAQYGNAGVFTPTPPHLLVLLGVPLAVTLIAGAVFLRVSHLRQLPTRLKTASPRGLILLAWLVVGGALLYVPTGYQIKMLVAWQVPLSVSCAWATFQAAHWLAARLRLRPGSLAKVAGVLVVIAVLPTSLYLVAWRVIDLQRHTYPYYLQNDEIDALAWLSDHSERSDVVLSSLTIGQYIPALSGNNAFLAHWAMTLDYYNKERAVEMFYSPQVSDAARAEMLGRFDVRYVFDGDAEHALGSYDISQIPVLERVFSRGDVRLFRVHQQPRVSLAARTSE